VAKVQEVTNGGSWKIPSASYASKDPKRATTLYASDRDVFIFMVDEDNPIEFKGEQLFRGFYAWNSEVGAQTFGLAGFLYRYICDNRIIWGMENKTELKIKHSSGAPERFLQEGKKALVEYANASTAPIIAKINAAQNKHVGSDEDEVKNFLKKRGLTLSQADTVIKAATVEESDYTNAWSLANGLSAYARTIKHTDSRVNLEKIAGKILEDV